MLLIILLIILFWALIPALITGWMFQERGKGFAGGLLLGAVCGPAGILAALVLILISDAQAARADTPTRARAFRVFYDLPVVGRLHVSTAWALAGVATFLCAWMLGGLGYELQQLQLRQATAGQGATTAQTRRAQMQRPPASNAPADAPQNEQKAEAVNAVQGNVAAQQAAPLLGSLAGQPGQTTQAARTDGATPQPLQPLPTASNNLTPAAPPLAVGVSAATPAVTGSADAPEPPAKMPAQSREAAVSEVTRILGARGHRVHASLSGDARTSTLSLSGATLTRGAGQQLLNSGRTREALKAAGVRIVVMVNGQESWTYIL